jgi:hypothetical protein
MELLPPTARELGSQRVERLLPAAAEPIKPLINFSKGVGIQGIDPADSL